MARNDTPVFTTETPQEPEIPETPPKSETPEVETPEDNAPKKDVPMIVYRQRYVDSAGVAHEKEHGPMPVTDWAAYEKEHNL